MAAKILLTEWAKRRYQPAPSAYVLRKLIADGALHPAPEKVGRDWPRGLREPRPGYYAWMHPDGDLIVTNLQYAKGAQA